MVPGIDGAEEGDVIPDEYAIGACGFSQTLRDQCRCSAFFVFRRGSASAFSAWWASMRRLRLSIFQQRLDNGIMPVVVLDSTKGWQSVSVCSCLIVHERSRDV